MNEPNSPHDPSLTRQASPSEGGHPGLQLWQGKAQNWDKILLALIFILPLVYLLLLPLRPWMLANAPLLQAAINGARTAVVASGAFASTGEFPLWWAILVGFIGRVKFDWALWLAGRRWGDNLIDMMASNPRRKRQVAKLKEMSPWILFLFTFLAATPGVPSGLVYVVAGYSRMRLWMFLTASLSGVLLYTIAYAVLGYQLGSAAIEVLQVIDRYAMWLFLGIAVAIFAWTFFQQSRKQQGR